MMMELEYNMIHVETNARIAGHSVVACGRFP